MQLKRTIPRRGFWAKHGNDVSGWLIMLPTLVLFCFFVWVPLLQAINLSLYEADGMRLTRFVGFQNYVNVFHNADFWPAVRNTLYYTLWSLALGFLTPMVMAVLVHESVRGKSLLRTAMYLPNIVPGLAMAFMWRFLFRDGAAGGLNMLLGGLGVAPQAWLSDPGRVIPLIVIAMTWKSAGATMLIYLAGLQGINPELYEAAIIDGANVRQRIWHITVPQLYNLGRTLLILQIIAVFQILYEPLVMTNGGPNNASISIMQLVYRRAFESFNYPEASAVSVIISIALVLLTIVYNYANKPKDM